MKTLPFILSFAIAVLALPYFAPVKAQEASAFDAQQKAAIETIVREYLISNPGIMREVFEALEKQEQEQQLAATTAAIEKHSKALFHDDDLLVVGNPTGDVTLVEFFDYNCGYCKRAMDDLITLMEEDSNLRVVMKEFPILTPGSIEAAQVALAAARQDKYWEFHQMLLSSRGEATGERALQVAAELGLDIEKLQADMVDEAIVQTIQSTQDLATEVGVNGTPAYVIGNKLVAGAVGVEELRAAISEARATSCATC